MMRRIAAVSFLMVFVSACTWHKLDEQTIDCSLSTLEWNATIIDADCGKGDGSIEVTATGGEMPYLYFLDNGSTQRSNLFGQLGAGTYMITVIDNASCSVSKEVSVGNVGGFQATASTTNAGCKSSDGSISVQATSGVEPYQYRINGGAVQASNMFAGLSSGDYEVLITDNSGCSFYMVTYVPSGISFTESVQPIIANSCATTNCHDGSTPRVNLSVFGNVKLYAEAIKSRTQSGSMPKGGSLTQAQKDAIACWVDDGALEN